MQLKVIKADGGVEKYLHTKVMGTISNALGEVGRSDTDTAEQLAEAVTYFLYHRQNQRNSTSSSEIFSIVKAVLTSTGYEEAAVALNEYHHQRKLKRCRVEVVSIDIQELTDAEMFGKAKEAGYRSRWDKSVIVKELVTKHNINRQTARTIASMVEQKIFNIGITQVPASLIKQLVWSDAAAVLQAERQLQGV